MAIPQPEPRDWQRANAQELQVTDREVLAMLRGAKKRVEDILKELPTGKQEIRRAQLEQTRATLLAEQADVFDRLGRIVEGRRARAAARSARLSAAADAALLSAVGQGEQGQYLYRSVQQIGQRAIDTALARMKLSALPLSQRIYNTSVWMGGRLGKLINETLASGINAQEFARRARDWFNPNTPGGVRYAAMRLARTEINNAFHAISAQKYADTPWTTQVDWNLSKSHPKPDICNQVAAESPYDKDETPARPHPQCMCYITARQVDEDEFIDRFLDGEYDDYLDGELAKAGWEEPEAKPEPKPVSTPVPAPMDTRTFAEKMDGAAKDEEALGAPTFSLAVRSPDRPAAFKQMFSSAINKYTGVTYKRINAKLRGLPDPGNLGDDPLENTIESIDSAMELSKLDKDVVVWRGMTRARTLLGDRIDSDLTGMEWREDAYTSTTALQRRTSGFIARGGQDNVLMRILAPKGTKAVTASGAQLEAEVLIARGARMRVVRDNGIDENGIRHLDMEVDTSGVESDRGDEGTAERQVQSASSPGADQAPVIGPALPSALTGEAAHSIVPKGLFKRGSLTPAQRKQLKVYESGWFAVINGFLRGGEKIEDTEDQRTSNTVDVIDEALDESILEQPIQTWRGMFRAKNLFGDRLDDDLTGFSWREFGYGSTTTDEDVTDKFMMDDERQDPQYAKQNVKMVVNVPAGVRALEISTSEKGSPANGPQAEIMLQRGMKWSVTKDHGYHPEKGYRLLEVTVSGTD